MVRPATFFLAFFAIGWLMAAPAATSAVNKGRDIIPGGPDLKTTLEKGLRARRPAEFAFVKLVVERVNEGTLPLPLVKSTFLWARNKPYPFPYFERGLRQQARRAGITF